MSASAFCYHCGQPADGTPFSVTLSGMEDDWTLAVCERCQSLRQSGQLPVELFVQQWMYAQAGDRPIAVEELAMVVIRLDCLACGAPFLEGWGDTGASLTGAPDARRLPDGSMSASCPSCQRTNVLERRRGQLVTVRLW